MISPQNSRKKDSPPDSATELSQDKRLNHLLNTVLREVKLYAEDQIKHIRRGAEIGKALSAEKNTNKILEMIVDEARAMSKADAGTLYILSRDKKYLRVEILQNDTMNIRIGGMDSSDKNSTDLLSKLPSVPLYTKKGMENHSNVSSHVALAGESISIPDVYKAEGFDFTGTRNYDKSTGYLSKSMLVIPLKNYENKIIGVLQLLNARESDTNEIISFSPEYIDLIESLASQAAVALTNAQLIQNLKDQIRRIKNAAEIGKALSVGDNVNKLLEMIVDEARDMSGADAGTLYMLDKNKKLRFKILQNDSMGIKLVGKDDKSEKLPDAPFTLPNVPLYNESGSKNYSNVSSYVALTGKQINISDVYEVDETLGFDFTGPRKYDASTGYRSRSMLVVPLKNYENEVIGVLQLLNAKNENQEIIPFSEEYVNLIESLASQAAVAMTNAELIRAIKNLFYALIESIATAIDGKSPYTGGHIRRVVSLTRMIAQRINDAQVGHFKDIYFNEDALEELELAAWMHDVGKITTPEHVIDKHAKLETICDRISLIRVRFQTIIESVKNEYLHRKIELLRGGVCNASDIEVVDKELGERLTELRETFEFIESCNSTGDFMSDEKVERVKKIASEKYVSDDGEHSFLTSDELENLCIRKGTLTDGERQIINQHSEMTYKILCTLPFPKSLGNVPDYAAAHHERPDGTGYPLGLSGEDLPIQPRIMAIADIFEALTARDRPYKKPMLISQAVRILGFMKKDGHIDPNIHDLFIESGLFREYAVKELNSDQIDM